MVIFHRSLSDSKSPRVSGILLSILTDFNNAVVSRQILTMLWSLVFWSLRWFPVPQFFFYIFRNCSKCTNYNRYHRYIYVPQLFKLSGKIQMFVFLFAFFFHRELSKIRCIKFFGAWRFKLITKYWQRTLSGALCSKDPLYFLYFMWFYNFVLNKPDEEDQT